MNKDIKAFKNVIKSLGVTKICWLVWQRVTKHKSSCELEKMYWTADDVKCTENLFFLIGLVVNVYIFLRFIFKTCTVLYTAVFELKKNYG